MAKRPRGSTVRLGRWNEDDARQLLREWADSGVNLHRFARERGITPQRLAWWRRRLTTGASAPVSFVPATVTVGSIGAPGGVVVRLPDGIAIELGEVAPTWVAHLIRELARPS
jgi:hypothetical protein